MDLIPGKIPVLHSQVDAQSHDGLTALGFAAAAGHLDIVTMLSQHAAKVDPHTGHEVCQKKNPTHFILIIRSNFYFFHCYL